MDFQPDSVPDDVWISIFENLFSPADLATLVRTCRRFSSLASKPLLREVRWRRVESTARNLDAWTDNPEYAALVSLPRKVVVALNFEFCTRNFWPFMNSDMQLHDRMYAQVQNFTRLHELVLHDTAISPYLYTVLGALPSLRSLSIINCTFIHLTTTFAEHRQASHSHQATPTPDFDFTSLPLTSLRLHKITFPVEPGPGFSNDDTPLHPLHLITASSLRSLSLTWTSTRAMIFGHRNWSLPSIEHLEVLMPFLTRDLVDSLVGFVSRCRPDVRIALNIERHNLSDQQITGIQIPLRGVWKYKGPLSFASFGPNSGARSSLTHLVMNEPADLVGLLHGLEKLPKCIQALDIQVRKWDIELLFAIRELFPNITYLVVRYGRGVLPVDFFVTLGADILFHLPHLHTLQLLNDKSCSTTRPLTPHSSVFWGGLQPAPPPPTTPHFHHHPHHLNPHLLNPHHHHHHHHHHHNFHNHQNLQNFQNFQTHQNLQNHAHTHPWGSNNVVAGGMDDASSDEPASAADDDAEGVLEQEDLRDYLVGWNRYCKCLRHVQLDESRWWERRFEGDHWVEVEIVDG